MSVIVTTQQDVLPKKQSVKDVISEKIRALLSIWELYPIVFIAAFLRLYHVNTTVFVDDDSVVFRLARDAFAHGLWPISSNVSSLGQLHLPMIVYLIMLPAALSANPLWAEVMIGLVNTLAVLLTYFFVRCYYGRFAGISAALLFATAARAIIYSRNIWAPNFLPFFTILFLFMLFRGVVDRRNGWVVPAVIFLCIIYQLHESGLFLIVPFVVAVVFAYKTIRWYDVVLSAVAALILFSPFLYLQYLNHGNDIRILLSTSGHKAQIDTVAIDYYKHFLSPYVQALDFNDHDLGWPTFPSSIMVVGVLRYFKLPMFLELEFAWLLLHCSIIFALFLVLVPHRKTQTEQENAVSARWSNSGLLSWWKDLYASPFRQGLLLLICWQAMLLTLTRHTIDLFPHYMIIFLPGQFILIGIFLGKGIEFFQHYRPDFAKVTRYGSYLLIILITGVQIVGSVGALQDNLHGRFDPQWYPGFNDLGSIQNALTRAEQLAQERHIHRIYISTVQTTANPVRLLAEQSKTPITTFDAQHCTVLPDPAVGPVVFLNDSRDGVIDELLRRYTSATLIAQLPHLANPPFNLYVLTANAPATPAPYTSTSDLQLLDRKIQTVFLPKTKQQLQVTRWRIENSAVPAPFTTYNFNFKIQASKTASMPANVSSVPDNVYCGNSALWAGDQMLLYQYPFNSNMLPSSLQIRAASFTSSPVKYALGPIKLTAYNVLDTPWKLVQTEDGTGSFTLSTT